MKGAHDIQVTDDPFHLIVALAPALCPRGTRAVSITFPQWGGGCAGRGRGGGGATVNVSYAPTAILRLQLRLQRLCNRLLLPNRFTNRRRPVLRLFATLPRPPSAVPHPFRPSRVLLDSTRLHRSSNCAPNRFPDRQPVLQALAVPPVPPLPFKRRPGYPPRNGNSVRPAAVWQRPDIAHPPKPLFPTASNRFGSPFRKHRPAPGSLRRMPGALPRAFEASPSPVRERAASAVSGRAVRRRRGLSRPSLSPTGGRGTAPSRAPFAPSTQPRSRHRPTGRHGESGEEGGSMTL